MAELTMKLELVPVPVSDADRAKKFYVEKLGFNADFDQMLGETRFIQLTPPGSACSIVMGQGITKAAPGSVDGLLLAVTDIEAVYNTLRERGVEISKPQMMPWGTVHADLQDPDGNAWTLQEKPKK